MLRAARERQGMHIAALAAAIKVTPRKLDALENDRWQELPDATFVRALAQTVCRTLKIDSKPVLALLPLAGTAGLDRGDAGLNTPFRPGREDASFAAAAIRPMVWAAAALMLAAVVLYFLPIGPWSLRPVAAAAPVAAASAASAAAQAASAVQAQSTAPLPAELAASTAPATTAAPAAPAASTALTVTTVAVPMVVAAPVLAAPAPATTGSAPGAGIAQLRGSQSSWVQVRDSRGQVLVSRTLPAGETLGLDVALPLRLTIGNAAGMQLVFRGRPVDLAPLTRDNVARVELQ